jgi:hypothetical protein
VICTGKLVVTSCWCSIHGDPTCLYKLANTHRTGTSSVRWATSYLLEHDRGSWRGRNTNSPRPTDAAERATSSPRGRSHAATKGHVTRKKRQLERVASGVCPCCNRSFVNLRRHMKTQHPEFEG